MLFPKDLSLVYTYLLLYLQICYALRIFSVCKHKIAHSICSATDSTLPQCDIDSICSRCVADLNLSGPVLSEADSNLRCTTSKIDLKSTHFTMFDVGSALAPI